MLFIAFETAPFMFGAPWRIQNLRLRLCLPEPINYFSANTTKSRAIWEVHHREECVKHKREQQATLFYVWRALEDSNL